MSTFTEQEHHCYGKFNITFLFLSKMLQNSCRILKNIFHVALLLRTIIYTGIIAQF